MKEYIEFWRCYTDFKGRTTRAGYWKAFAVDMIFSILFGLFLTILLALCLRGDPEEYTKIILFLLSLFKLVKIVPATAIKVRRLRDAGYSWRSLFWTLVPGIGSIALLYRLCAKSAAEDVTQIIDHE